MALQILLALAACSIQLGLSFHATSPDIVPMLQTEVPKAEDAQEAVETKAASGEASSFGIGAPHSKNIKHESFNIRRPGKHGLLVLPKDARVRQAQLYVEAHVTARGGVCQGPLYITSLKLAGKWLRALGGDIELYAATDAFNSPEVVGLKVGGSGNMSLQEFVARIPERKLKVFKYRPARPAELNAHVNTLMLQFRVGESAKLKVGWSHQKLKDGSTNWLWISASGLGDADEVGGLLGSDDHSAEQEPQDCKIGEKLAASGEEPNKATFRSWASVEV